MCKLHKKSKTLGENELHEVTKWPHLKCSICSVYLPLTKMEILKFQSLQETEKLFCTLLYIKICSLWSYRSKFAPSFFWWSVNWHPIIFCVVTKRVWKVLSNKYFTFIERCKWKSKGRWCRKYITFQLYSSHLFFPPNIGVCILHHYVLGSSPDCELPLWSPGQ